MKKLFDLESVTAETLDGGFIVRIGELHRVVDVEPATAVGNPDLRALQADAHALALALAARHHPESLPSRPALDDGKAENPRVEVLRSLEIEWLLHKGFTRRRRTLARASVPAPQMT